MKWSRATARHSSRAESVVVVRSAGVVVVPARDEVAPVSRPDWGGNSRCIRSRQVIISSIADRSVETPIGART